MNRAQFIRRMLAGAASIAVGDEVLEAYERLTHRRRFFPSAEIGRRLIEGQITFAHDSRYHHAMLVTFRDGRTPLTIDFGDGRKLVDARVISIETGILIDQPACYTMRFRGREA